MHKFNGNENFTPQKTQAEVKICNKLNTCVYGKAGYAVHTIWEMERSVEQMSVQQKLDYISGARIRLGINHKINLKGD